MPLCLPYDGAPSGSVCKGRELMMSAATAVPINATHMSLGLRILGLEIFAPAVRADSTLDQLALVWSLEVLAILTTLASVWLVLVFGFRFADLLLLGLCKNRKSRACQRRDKPDRSHQISA